MKTDLFQSCGHCWVFQICWHIECSTFTASSFRIWNSSTGIPSPPLALFVVMLSKANLMSTGEGNGKPFQYSCLENPMNSMKRQNDRILKEELPRSVGAQYPSGDQWRNNSRKNEGMEPKQKQYPVLDVTHDRNRRRQWHPTPVLLPGKSHGWRNLVGCSPWGREESDTTERLHFHFSLSRIGEGNGNPLQCSCLENPRDGGAWWAAVYGSHRVGHDWSDSSSSSSSDRSKDQP